VILGEKELALTGTTIDGSELKAPKTITIINFQPSGSKLNRISHEPVNPIFSAGTKIFS
jgi:hypothetical protein